MERSVDLLAVDYFVYRVAREAGVSIGSLYQYFPSKEALITSVMNQWADLTTREAVEAFQTLEHAPLQQGIARLVQLVMQATGRHPVLNKALLEQVHRAGFREALEHTNRRFEDLFTRWLEGRTDELAVDDLPMASHLVLRSMIALCENALLHRPERLTSKRFATHLERLALAYLTQK